MDRYPFDVFTEDAKRVLVLAQEEAENARGGYIGTEHLLFGILRLRSGSGYRALLYLDVEERTLRSYLRKVMRDKPDPGLQTPIPNMRTKSAIELAFGEAKRMGTPRVHSAHLLMGVVKEGSGIGALLLRDVGVDADRIITAAERQLM